MNERDAWKVFNIEIVSLHILISRHLLDNENFPITIIQLLEISIKKANNNII